MTSFDIAHEGPATWPGARPALGRGAAADFVPQAAFEAIPEALSGARARISAFGDRFWRTMIGVGGLLVLVVLSSLEISTFQALRRAASPEGLTVGFWWALSVTWLIQSLWRPPAFSAAARGFRPRSFGNRALRAYFALTFSALCVVEMVQQGQRAQLGVLCGAGAFVALFLIGRLAITWRAVQRETRTQGASEPEQLPLPFA